MSKLPEKELQIRQSHAVLIHQVVRACQNSAELKQLEPLLRISVNNGWLDLVKAIRNILDGNRDESLLTGLDEDDAVIIKTILVGLQNPETLPNLAQEADPAVAAPGLAHLIYAASRGDVDALDALAFMAEQMTNTHGDMRRLGGIIGQLVEGECDAEKLCEGMTANGEQLVLGILREIGRLSLH